MHPACCCLMRRMSRVPLQPVIYWLCCGCTTISWPDTVYGRSFSAGRSAGLTCPPRIGSFETVLSCSLLLRIYGYRVRENEFICRFFREKRVPEPVILHGYLLSFVWQETQRTFTKKYERSEFSVRFRCFRSGIVQLLKLLLLRL